MTETSAPAVRPGPTRSWLAWSALVGVCAIALVAVVGALSLRGHADKRHAVVQGLEEFETMATAQSGLMWKGLTQQVAEETHAFIRLRGEEQRGRGAMMDHLEAVRRLDERGKLTNRWLGFEPDPELWEQLDGAAFRFMGGVQGVFGQMSLSAERVRRRLGHWDVYFGTLLEALDSVKARNTANATAAASAADKATVLATLITLLAAGLGIWRLVRLRARRVRDLHQTRMTTLAASEARFKALVQDGSDLILVAEADGSLRYASPSCAAFLAFDDQGRPTGSVETVFGVKVDELVAATATEVVVRDDTEIQRVLDVRGTDLTSKDDVRGVVLNARDVTARKQLEDKLRHQALHDPLTDLPNRRGFKLMFDQAVGSTTAVLFLDLDGFKRVNDSYGHRTGDALLVEAARRIQTCLQDGDVLARQGGDEFLVLLDNPQDAMASAKQLCGVMEPPFALEETEVFVTASIGVVTDVEGIAAEVAAQQADIAMYCAKRAGRGRAVMFSDEMLGDAPERIALETDFRRGLERGEFAVHYQPKVSFASGKIESLEALVRWEHPTRGMVRPDLFIGFAEETGLISELGCQILSQACMDAVRWQDQGVVVAVNLSPIQFRNPRLVDEVREALESSGLNPKQLELEITESAVLGDVKATVAVLDQLKALGVRLAIDDFGTGYSNLSHLKHFNVDVLKIDQSFVRGGNPGTADLSDSAIVEAVIAMAKAFDLHVVAEGVETLQHANELEALGADLGQGYYFSKPVAGLAIDALLAEESATPAS